MNKLQDIVSIQKGVHKEGKNRKINKDARRNQGFQHLQVQLTLNTTRFRLDIYPYTEVLFTSFPITFTTCLNHNNKPQGITSFSPKKRKHFKYDRDVEIIREHKAARINIKFLMIKNRYLARRDG